MTASGHEDQFPPPSLNDRCRLGEPTFAGMGGNELNAPIPAVRRTRIVRLKSIDPKAAVNPVAKSVFWRAECTNRIWLGREYHDRSRDRLKSISSPGKMPATFPSLIAPVSCQSAGRSRSV
jgi:hypothetical protein